MKEKTIGEKFAEMLKEDVKIDEKGEMFLEGVKDKVKIGKVDPKNIEISEEKIRKEIKPILKDIIVILKKYMDLEEDYYLLIAIWILGTYFHQSSHLLSTSLQTFHLLFFLSSSNLLN